MGNKEILTKAIEKAISNGLDWELEVSDKWIVVYKNGKGYNWSLGGGEFLPGFIFDKEFAKALWGEGNMSIEGRKLDAGGMHMFDTQPINDWKSNLQQMVVAKDPIKYLGEHLG